MYLLIFLLIIIILFAFSYSHSGSAEKSEHYLYLPEEEIKKIETGKKLYQIRYPKLGNDLMWENCVGCDIVYFFRPEDVPREETIKATFQKHKEKIKTHVKVEITEVDKFDKLDDVLSKMDISGEEAENLQKRFPSDSVETSGGIVVLHFKVSSGKMTKSEPKAKAKPKAKPKKKGKGEEEEDDDM